jgi:FMN phosphatase YigB (HAD superfamily)
MLKAVFFDRDGTLAYDNHSAIEFRDKKISEWSGHIFELPYEKFINVFLQTKKINGLFKNIKTIKEERMFFSEFYRTLLTNEGISTNIDEKIKILMEKLWVHEKKLFPETIEVLEYFKNRNIEMGVISDAGITLEETLKILGITKYFKSFTSSAEAGVGKPDPKIYTTALKKHNVNANESIYVDDYDIAVDGARNLGFTSFLIDRNSSGKDNRTIMNLKDIIKYVEENKIL